jgi:hypothetical protein
MEDGRERPQAASSTVELYQPAGSGNGPVGVERAREAAERLTSEGMRVWYVRSILIPAAETCFHVFEGVSAEAIGAASRRAAIDYERIVEVLQ